MEINSLRKLMSEMSLEEKVGQMVQMDCRLVMEGGVITGPVDSMTVSDEERKLIGSILSKIKTEETKNVQDKYMANHPHHIPLMFMCDVINGMETIFPIPLAQGCTFHPELVEECARVAAREASVSGVHVTFSPMLDLVRDPRWGRVMETPGEDPWLNSQMAKAMVRGYQGCDKNHWENLKQEGNMASCLKHFAGYGAPEGGRDYDNVELSERTFREEYLPAYHAAVDEGCAMAMTSFNSLNRIPSSGNEWLMRKVLREEMGFDGVLISDYSAIEEMVCHGIAEDSKEAALLAIHAGVDIDMMSNCYIKHLADLVREGKVSEDLVDEAVWRILTLKNNLGLFENPYKDLSVEKEKALFACEEHRKVARQAACESFVLLKNEEILPLTKEEDEKILFVGPYVDSKVLFGAWSWPSDQEALISVKQGVMEKLGENIDRVEFVQGSYMEEREITENDTKSIKLKQMIQNAVSSAKKAGKVVVCIGDDRLQSGEGHSKTNISIPENQMQMLREIYKVNQNIVTLVFSGRPVLLQEILKLSKAVMMVWMPGTEGGNAIADVIFGDVVPQGKLSMTIPRTIGQIPVYYNRFMTGRPNLTGEPKDFINAYRDESIKPLYPFGYGLSYTQFAYSEVKLSDKEMKEDKEIIAKVTVTNVGDCAGIETVQLYLRDVKGSVIRPVKMLRGVQKVFLQPKESKEVSFVIREEMLRFYDINMNYVSEPGVFHVFIGADSDTANRAEFRKV